MSSSVSSSGRSTMMSWPQSMLCVRREKSVDEDNRCDRRQHLLGDARDDATRIGMADQDDVLQVLEFDHVHDVGDVRVQIDAGGEKMNALAQACERRRVDLVPAP